MEKIALNVYGKINLSLNIVGVSGKMHLLDSVLASISLCDTICVRKRNDDKINLIFNADFVPENNTVIKAVGEMKNKLGAFGVDITVDKRLPLSGGMGGSSADAAGVIAAISCLYGFDIDQTKDVCAKVGADVYYMLRGGYAKMSGVGDIIEPIDCSNTYEILCINDVGTLTSLVYKQYDEVGGDGFVDNDLLIAALQSGKAPMLGNMLTRAASGLNANILRNIDAFKRIGLSPNMTGSGATVYAITANPSLDIDKLRQMGFNAYCARTRDCGIEFL